MGNEYYYFAATLPLIFFDRKPPFAIEDFLSQCKMFLSEKDYLLIETLFSDEESCDGSQNVVAKKWMEYSRNLRNEIAWYRANKAKLDSAKHLKGEKSGEYYFFETVNNLFKESNLLNAQRMLDGARWKYLEELEFGHYFDFEFIIIYGIKLKILQRQQELSSPKGEEILEEYKKIEIDNQEPVHN